MAAEGSQSSPACSTLVICCLLHERHLDSVVVVARVIVQPRSHTAVLETEAERGLKGKVGENKPTPQVLISGAAQKGWFELFQRVVFQ